MSAHELDYIVSYYKVPAARGVHVSCQGKIGVIAGVQGAYVMVRFAGAKHSLPCHPTWEMKYFDAHGAQIWPAVEVAQKGAKES